MTTDGSGTAFRSIRTLFGAGAIGGLADEQLLERFATLDGEAAGLAFEALVERHGPMVLRVCRGVLRDAHDAEDAFQATFLILARKAGSIRGRQSLASWLFGVARNVAATARSGATRRRLHELNAGRSRPRSSADPAGDDLGAVVQEEIARLPVGYRSAVVLCCLEGLTQQEAAQHLGWPLGTLQSRLARGRARLRDRLSRRGLAPSAAPPLLGVSNVSSPGPVPAGLVSETTRTAATGAVPVAVATLAGRAVRAMLLKRLMAAASAVLLASGIVAAGAAVRAHATQDPKPAPSPPGPVPTAVVPAGDGLLSVAGTVIMPDGSPAAGAVVESRGEEKDSPAIARADAAGRFVLRGVFGTGGHLLASSADGKLQARYGVPSVATRAASTSPLALTLAPAVAQEVTVEAGGRPVAGAHVAALGDDFTVRGVTGRDGRVELRYPAGEDLRGLVAWHPELGVAGLGDRQKALPRDPARLSLLTPGPRKIRVVDQDGKPVAGLGLGVSCQAEGTDWIVAREIEAARVRTDGDGWAAVPWAPRESLKYLDVDLIGPDWKIDEIDRKRFVEGIMTVQARPERPVEGRLVLPEGADAEGILVTGFGFGPSNRGDIPYARARRDGRFTIRVPSEHGFVLGISDLKWAADPWSGVILGKDGSKPAEIVMNVYPATPVTARVTRGPGREPVVNAYVELSSKGRVAWTDPRGEKRSGETGVQGWLRTDAAGVVRAGVGRGEHAWRLSSGPWGEERTFKVDSTRPVEVEFHRPWVGDQKIVGRLTLGGTRYEPSPALVARAWTPQRQMMPLEFPTAVHPDGTFEVAFDAEAVSLYFFDREKQEGGYARQVRGDAPVEVAMESTTPYGGVLVDENDRPMPDRPLQVVVKSSSFEAVAPQRTDPAGRFRFPGVPANVPLELNLRHEGEERDYFLSDRDRMFKPGEVRADDRLRASRAVSPGTVTRPTVPLADGVDRLRRNAHATGLRVLIVLLGDASPGVVNAADRLLDDERGPSVLSYLPLRVESARLDAEAVTLGRLGSPRPAPGEIVLFAMDGEGKAIGSERVATRDGAAAVGLGDAFLKRHSPPRRDALAVLGRARMEAKATGRRVWVVHGGPRCGPCFRMARWVEEHRAALEKDYVFVEAMDLVDDRVAEVVAGLPEGSGDGIPWHAITEPDGTILATSVGPLGNIGFPSSVEEVRHLAGMIDRTARKLTPADREAIVKPLSAGR